MVPAAAAVEAASVEAVVVDTVVVAGSPQEEDIEEAIEAAEDEEVIPLTEAAARVAESVETMPILSALTKGYG